MIFHLTIHCEMVIVSAHMEGVGGLTGSYNKNILPGDNFGGIPYDLLLIHAEKAGWIEVEEGTT